MKQAIIKDPFRPAFASLREAQEILDRLVALLRSRPEEAVERHIGSLEEAKAATEQLVEFLEAQSRLAQ